MTEFHDFLCSIVIGGIILTMVLGFNTNIAEKSVTQSFNSIVQSNLTTVTSMLEHDFRKMGYFVFDSLKVLLADTNNIIFRADLDNDGTIDTVGYRMSYTRDTTCVNPRARILYRVISNQGMQSIHLGVTQFKLWYYDGQGFPTANLSNIKSIKVAFHVESMAPYDTIYAGAYWERVIKPKNLR
ncbi:MAG: hypothetical protein HY707_09965 [Ignavibacteriae bacterium]|nr:hypothetical protein [Ignavibacteriota bacterium]